MDTIQKSKWQVRGAAVLIFVLGFAAGALALGLRWYPRDHVEVAGAFTQSTFHESRTAAGAEVEMPRVISAKTSRGR